MLSKSDKIILDNTIIISHWLVLAINCGKIRHKTQTNLKVVLRVVMDKFLVKIRKLSQMLVNLLKHTYSINRMRFSKSRKLTDLKK